MAEHVAGKGRKIQRIWNLIKASRKEMVKARYEETEKMD